MLNSALEHYRRQQRLTVAALLAVKKARPAQYAEIVTAFQILAARDALTSVPLMLDEQGIEPDPVANVAPASVAGVASDGRPLASLFEQAANQSALALMVATQIQDAARGAAGLGIAVRPQVTGYVRMLSPPSCSRCAILAGKFFRWNTGFSRHPKCDCRHIPSTEDRAGDLTTNPDAYFHSLSSAEQDRIFTKAGAQAVRDGADLGQVVNARRGMATMQFGKRTALVTREGTTARGLAGNRLGSLRKAEGERYRRSGRPRVMPETIYAVAKDRGDAVRLLKLNGFIL